MSHIDSYNSRRSTVHAPHGIVTTSQPLAAQAGLKVLRDGGNAFDAAVTAATTLTVVEPFSTGLGGDVFALYRTADDDVSALTSIGHAPLEADLETVRKAVATEQPSEDTDRVLKMPESNALSVTVPGAARGWEKLLEKLGTVPLERALAPAIEYAEDGFPVTEVIANQWSMWSNRLESEEARETYLFDGHPPKRGEHITFPRLADTYRKLAKTGSDVVYTGEIGDKIVETVQSKGGFLSQQDLSTFEARFVEPISTTYNGVTVYELPPPNQGPIALEALNIAEAVDAGSYPLHSVDGTHLLIESLKRAYHDGHQYVADPDFESIPPVWEKIHADHRAQTVTDRVLDDIPTGFPGTNGDTVLVTVGDDNGNVVSLINSIFLPFGSGLVAEDTGVLLKNRGHSFSLEPSAFNRFEPGKRPFHTLIPSVVQFDNNDWAAFGVMGGYMQPQGQLQVLSAIIDHGLTLQQALDQPRWFYRETGDVAIESRFDDTLSSQLIRRGHDMVVDVPDEFGGGQIVRARNGTLSGATDPRKDGAIASY